MRAVTQEELQLIAGGLIKKAPPKLREMLMKPPGGSAGGGTPSTWNTPVTVTAGAPGTVYGGHGFGGGTPGAPPSTGGGYGGGGGTISSHDVGAQVERYLTGGGGSNPDPRDRFFNLDLAFIHSNESNNPLLVSVPHNNAGTVLGHSGITIGYGFDLGQTTDAALKEDVSAGVINQSLYNTIAPWVGLQGQAALTYAEQHNIQGIDLPATDLLSLQYVSDVKLNSIVQQLNVSYYDATASSGLTPSFLYMLPGGVQTAIADVAEQYGPDLADKAPTFWSDITHFNWAAAENELQHFGDAYSTRRTNDATYMQEGVNQGGLINGRP